MARAVGLTLSTVLPLTIPHTQGKQLAKNQGTTLALVGWASVQVWLPACRVLGGLRGGPQLPGPGTHLEQLFFQLQGPRLELHQCLLFASGRRLQLSFQSLLQGLVPTTRSCGTYPSPRPCLPLSAPPAMSPPLLLELLVLHKFMPLLSRLLQLPLQTLQPGPQLLAPHHSLFKFLRASRTGSEPEQQTTALTQGAGESWIQRAEKPQETWLSVLALSSWANIFNPLGLYSPICKMGVKPGHLAEWLWKSWQSVGMAHGPRVRDICWESVFTSLSPYFPMCLVTARPVLCAEATLDM